MGSPLQNFPNNPTSLPRMRNEILQTVNNGVTSVIAARGVPFVTSGTAENVGIVRFTLPAGWLERSGDGIEFDIWGVNSADANAKTVTIGFGAAGTLAHTVTGSGAAWRIQGKIVRMGTDVQRAMSTLIVTATPSLVAGSFTEDDGVAITVDLAATAATAGTVTINGAVFSQLRGPRG
ncbi:MAG: hypothetical protein C4555_05225 [Dehalococcoidia bacterium]|nr:MAG: hypothetical protein C4555_05225 [Dehalococcoidia bacterium]